MAGTAHIRVILAAFILGVAISVPLAWKIVGAAEIGEEAKGRNAWQPSPTNPGAFYMPLIGDAKTAGPYVYRFKAPAGFHVPAHWHTTGRHQTVLKGVLITVSGEPLVKSRAERLPVGSFHVTPANVRHEEWFKEETIVHIETEGPMETIFVNPLEDPRKKAAETK